MTDTHYQVFLTLIIINETTIHTHTANTKGPVTNATLPIEYETEALHTDLHALSTNAGTIGQHVAIEGHHLQVGQTQTLTAERQNTFTTAQGTEEKMMTVL